MAEFGLGLGFVNISFSCYFNGDEVLLNSVHICFFYMLQNELKSLLNKSTFPPNNLFNFPGSI